MNGAEVRAEDMKNGKPQMHRNLGLMQLIESQEGYVMITFAFTGNNVPLGWDV